MEKYRIFFHANYSGLASLDLDSSVGLNDVREARTLKEARKIAAELRRKYGGAYTEIEILKISNGYPVYQRSYGKLE